MTKTDYFYTENSEDLISLLEQATGTPALFRTIVSRVNPVDLVLIQKDEYPNLSWTAKPCEYVFQKDDRYKYVSAKTFTTLVGLAYPKEN